MVERGCMPGRMFPSLIYVVFTDLMAETRCWWPVSVLYLSSVLIASGSARGENLSMKIRGWVVCAWVLVKGADGS